MPRETRWRALDYVRRCAFLKNEIKRVLTRGLSKNTAAPLVYRYFIFFKKLRLGRGAALTRQKNRCVRTGRAVSVARRAQYSRFVFRTESGCGNLPGFRRASW